VPDKAEQCPVDLDTFGDSHCTAPLLANLTDFGTVKLSKSIKIQQR